MKNFVIFVVALCFLGSTSTALALEFSIDALAAAIESNTVADYLALTVAYMVMNNPVLALTFTGLSAAMPLIGFIANKTQNPHDNAALIFINKLLQTLAFNGSTNQPDVLSWSQMLANKPSKWPDMIEHTVNRDVRDIRSRVNEAARKRFNRAL